VFLMQDHSSRRVYPCVTFHVLTDHARPPLLRVGKDQRAEKLRSVIESVKMAHRTQPTFYESRSC
jgi:hypothetical protein